MITTAAQWKSPHLFLEKETIIFMEGSKKFRFPINNISKMYLRPRKSYSLAAMLGTAFAMNDKTYTLCVTTRDDKEFKIRVNGYEKHLYIDLVSQVSRILNLSTPMMTAS